jgi:hypothetical protein
MDTSDTTKPRLLLLGANPPLMFFQTGLRLEVAGLEWAYAVRNDAATRTRNTAGFLELWEQLHNPDFKSIEFDGFKETLI